MNNLYTKEAIELYNAANYICNKLYKPEVGCVACKYIVSNRCKVACLEEFYDILDLKKLEKLDINHYVENHSTCKLSSKVCNKSMESNCALCLLDILLKDKNVKFIKKEDSDGK